MNHKDIKMYKEYLEYSLNKCKRIYKESNNSNDKMNLLIELIEKQLTTLNK